MGTASSRRTLRVLVVEDEAILALEMELLLTQEGHQVVGVADDAARAIALASHESPELALVDLHLTDGLTGPEIAATLINGYKVPVLFVTSEWATVAEFEGAVGLLNKPFTREMFVDAVRYAAARLEETECRPPFGLRLLGRKKPQPG